MHISVLTACLLNEMGKQRTDPVSAWHVSKLLNKKESESEKQTCERGIGSISCSNPQNIGNCINYMTLKEGWHLADTITCLIAFMGEDNKRLSFLYVHTWNVAIKVFTDNVSSL